MAVLTPEVIARAMELRRQAQAQEAQRQADAQAAAEQAAYEAEMNRGRTWGEVAQDVPLQLLSGAVGLGQAAYGLGNIASLGLLDRAVGLSDNFAETQNILAGWQSAPTQRAAARVQGAFDQGIGSGVAEAVTSPLFLQQLLLQSAPSLLPGAAAARLGGAAAAANATARGLSAPAAQQAVSQAAQRAVGRAVGGQVAGAVNVDTINAAEAQGASPLEAQLGGIGAGLLAGVAAPLLMRATGAGALEAAAANALPGGARAAIPAAAGGIARQTLTGGAREGVEEGAQSATEQLATNLFTPNTDLFAGVGQHAALGAIAGGMLGAGMGATVGASQIRTSANTSLGQEVARELEQLNADQGSPLTGRPLSEINLGGFSGPVEEINLGDTPLPVESIDLSNTPLPGAEMVIDELPIEEVELAPAPRRSLYDITGRRPQPAQPPLPVMQVEELPAPARPGALGVIDAQRNRGQLGGTDLFAGQLPPEGAFPTPQPAPAADQTPLPRNPDQRALDFNAPPPTWKQALARQLGLKPQHFRGAAWDRFVAAVGDAQPFTPEGDAAIRRAIPEIAGDPATAPLFAARLAEQYAEAEPTATPRTLADALAMTEDDYIRAVNPTGATTAADDMVIVRQGDLELPEQTTLVERFQDRAGGAVEVRSDSAGSMYAVRGGEVLGQVSPGDTDTIVNVVQEAQGQGVGTGLMAAFVRANPFAQAGSFSPAGEATRRAAFRRLQQEQAGGVVEQAVEPAQPATPGSPAEGTLEAAETAVTGAEIQQTTEGIDQYMNRVAREQDAAESPEIILAAQLAGARPAILGDYVRAGLIQRGSPAQMASAYPAAAQAYEADLMARAARDEVRNQEDARARLARGELQGVDVAEAVEMLGSQPTTGVVTAGASANDAMRLAPTNDPTPPATNDAPALPRVTGSKQVRQGDMDGGTYHEVSLSDGRTARIQRATGDGGLSLSGWYWTDRPGDTSTNGVYLGETKADALRALPQAMTRSNQAVAPPQSATPGSPREGALGAAGAWADQGVLAEASREDNGVELRRLNDLVVTGAVTIDEARRVVARADRAARIARDRAVAGDYIQEYVARVTSQPYTNASTIGRYEGDVAGLSVRDARARLDEIDRAEAAALNVASPTDPIERTIQAFMRDDPSLDRQQAAADAFGDLLMDAPSSDVIDEYFIAIKAHPDWNNLTDAQRDQLVNDFDLRYTALENGTARFDRAEAKPKTPLGAGVFIRSVRAANANRPAGSPEVVAMDNVALFEATTGHAAPPDARGVYVDGKVYLIRENIGSTKELATVLAHERGHAGLEALLGSRMTAVTNRLWTNAATRKRVQAKMQQLGAGTSRRLAAEEVLADMLANGEQVNGDVITKARAAIEDSFARLLGLSDLRMTNSEVDAILRDAAAISRGTSPTAIDMSKSHLQGLEYAVGDPATFVAGDPRFSRAVADVNEDIDADAPAQRRSLAASVHKASLSALQKVKSIGTVTAADKARALMLDWVPLNQLANLYDRLFDGALTTLARTKRLKEATSNKIITQKIDLKYGDESVGPVSPVDTTDSIKAFSNRSPDQFEKWNQLQQTATLYRIWPDRAWEDQSAIDYTTAGFTEAERRQMFTEVKTLWKQVGSEGRKLYKETQAIYRHLWERKYSTLKKELARAHRVDGRSDDDYLKSPQFRQDYGSMIDAAMGRITTGPYSPLQRHGDYLVTVRSADGKVAWFDGFDTYEEATLARNDLVNGQYADGGFTVSPVTLRREQTWDFEGINFSTIRRLEQATDAVVSQAADPSLHKAIHDALVDAYLSSLPTGVFHQHANQRRNVRGGQINALRAFSDYTTKAARRIAALQYDGPISSQLAELQTKATEGVADKDGILRQRVVEAVKRQHAASINVGRSAVADKLSQGGYLWFLSSPSQLLINSSQTFMVTLPRLAGTYGSAPALRQLQRALVDFTKSRGNLQGEHSVLPEGSAERAVMQELFERGTLDFTQSHDMKATADGEIGPSMSGHWRKALEVGGIFMSKSEVFNRQIVALATTRLEMEARGLASDAAFAASLNDARQRQATTGYSPAPEENTPFTRLANVADAATLTTQFDFSQSNKPPVMQGPWRKLIFQFQTHRLNMLAMIGKDIRDSMTGTPEEKQTARRALAWMLGVQLALTGAAGSILAPMAFFIADLFRDDDDLVDSQTAFVQAMPQWAAHGLLSGAIDLSRVDFAGLVSAGGRYAPAEASAKETFNHYVIANLGPWAGLGANIFTGIEKAMEGDHVAAVKNLAPSGVGQFYRAVFESAQGAKDARQIVYYDPSPYDTVLGAMGLRSGDRRAAEDLRGATYEATMRAQALRSRYLGRLALGYSTGDQDMIDAANESINGWNSRYPDMAIGAPDIKRAIVNRVRSQANADMFGVGSARLPSQSIQQAVGIRPE